MRQRGFTLLEVMVAFIIAAIAIAALLRGAAGGLQNAGVAAQYQEAVSRARSRLAEATLAPMPGQSGGDDGGGFNWQVRVQPEAEAPPPRPGIDPPLAGRPVLYAVTASVSFGSGSDTRHVTLATQRLGPAPP